MTRTAPRTVADLLASARTRLDRVDPHRAATLVAAGGAYLVDTRPGWQRAQEGELPAALIIERNHLEWRLDPASDAARWKHRVSPASARSGRAP
jgi:hypothetical protein